MKFFKYLFPSKKNTSSSDNRFISRTLNGKSKSPKSFGEKRAQEMNSSLSKSIKERKQLVRKEFSSPDPLRSVYKHKGARLDAKIRRITS